MPYGINFGYGIQRLMDCGQRWQRAGHTVYLRRRNFPDDQDKPWAQLGFTITPTGGVGTYDTEIMPPPAVMMMTLRNIAQSMGKLRYGARSFLVSGSFVSREARALGYSEEDQRKVWQDPSVVGLVLENLLFTIEDVGHEEAAGKTISWVLICNANEVR